MAQAIFLNKKLLQEQTSPWALILTEPVAEVFEFHYAYWPDGIRTLLEVVWQEY